MNRKLLLLPALFLVGIAIPRTTQGQTRNAPPSKPPSERPKLHIPRVPNPPRPEDFWEGVRRDDHAAVTDFRQREPGDGTPATRPTAAYLSYDDESLYVIFVCRDDPTKVRARMTRREDIEYDDQVAVYLDTFHDRHRAYVFAANPLGVQSDAVFTEGQEEADHSFDTIWRSEGRLTHDGYAVLITVPFKSLRFPNAPVQDWGIALERVIFRNGEHSFWPYISNRYEGFVPQMASLAGLAKISGGRNIQLIPYGTLTGARYLDTSTNRPAFVSTARARGGLDAKLILHDAFALDVTANPDFSEVESDDPQVTINQRLEVSFPEKRPFFLENAGFFQTPLNLFYSRRIVAPQFGVRLTGKAGPWAVGILGVNDRQAIISEPEVASGPEPEESPPMHAALGVVRVEREFGEGSGIGFFASNRNLGGSWDKLGSAWNRVYSIDGRFKLGPNLVLQGQLAGSSNLELNRRRLSGSAAVASLVYTGRHLNSVTKFQDLSPNFRAELGYIPRVDIREVGQTVTYLWRPEGHRLLSFGPTVSGTGNWDHQGRLQDWLGTAEFEFNFTGSTQFKVARNTGYEYYGRRGFHKQYTELSAYTEPLRWLGFSGTLNIGTAINYNPGGELDPFLANSAGSSVGVTIRPSSRLRMDETYIYDGLASHTNGTQMRAPSIYNNHLVRSKLNYQFTRALSLRAILDYNGVLPNPSFVDLERQKRFTGNILLTWLPYPGTAVYLGYTDTFENLTLDPLDPSGLRRTGTPTVPTGRQIFFKISYLFRF